MGPEVTAFAPGSASNLGPGFDCLGMALAGAGDQVTARLTGGAGVRVRTVSDPRIPTDAARNTAAIAAAAVLRRAGSDAGMDLAVQKGLPLAGGMGGSAASAVAGAVAADAAVKAGLPLRALLEAALEAESVVAGRHADNVAPSLFGGAVLILGIDPFEMAVTRVHDSLVFVLATPSYEVETARARAVLPAAIGRAEGVAQASHLAALLLGLERGDVTLIGKAMVDRIAHPARAGLYPGYAEAREAGLEAGACGIAVSGAGPTLIAVTPRGSERRVAEAVEAAYGRAGHHATTRVAEVDREGARLLA